MNAAHPTPLADLRQAFAGRLQENVQLANYTTARTGGTADALLIVHDAGELEEAARLLWQWKTPFILLGSGSNVLFSDRGYRGVVVINRAKTVKIDAQGSEPSVWAESGANFGALARQAALRGLSGLEWAVTIPGSLGGAVYGNAGAHGSDMQANLMLAEILHPERGKEIWPVEKMNYAYRTSVLKRNPGQVVILAARLRLTHSSPAEVQARVDEFTQQRRASQPNGASLGSMFKNPAGDYAGRLIEAAGLKGTRIGGVHVSQAHANFFINDEHATGADMEQLLRLVQQTVYEKFSVRLEPEIEMVGDWPSA